MKPQTAPTLLLAVALQFLPICRVACVNQGAAPTRFAIVFRWFAGAVALLGSFHAVSGASAAIVGVANTLAPGPVSSSATGKAGQPFSYRIIVTNPGVNPEQAYWDAAPLPPGLTINTNIGGNGWITGTPTTAGVYPVTLTAGNANFATPVHKDITITITGGASPPLITVPPANQIVLAGSNVTLTVFASGDGLAYQWFFNSNSIPNATTPALNLPNVTPDQSGFYSVTVSNSAGSVVSPQAQLLIVPAPNPTIAPTLDVGSLTKRPPALSFRTLPGYRYIVQYSETPMTTNWFTLTNAPPSFTGMTINLAPDMTAAPQRYYRVQVTAD